MGNVVQPRRQPPAVTVPLKRRAGIGRQHQRQVRIPKLPAGRWLRTWAFVWHCALAALALGLPLAAVGQQAGMPVRFGILPLGGAFESRNDWDPLLADLSKAIVRPVAVLSVTSYDALEQAIQRNEVDMAFLSGKMALDAVTLRQMKVVAQVTLLTLTNYLNNVATTDIDFPPSAH